MTDKHNPMCTISMILLVIGGLNWGLSGIGMLMRTNLNVVNLILGSIPTLEAIIYLLVGVAAVLTLAMVGKGGCDCKK